LVVGPASVPFASKHDTAKTLDELVKAVIGLILAPEETGVPA
jgi:hypothetical protein